MAERLGILVDQPDLGVGPVAPAARDLPGRQGRRRSGRDPGPLGRPARAAIPASVRAIGRAGAGTNNIPVAAMSARGVPVFNAPGANANAVKELVLAGMLMAARQIAPALRFVGALDTGTADLDKAVEEGKKAFAGYELCGQTLGIIGLGKIGCLVADAAIKLGMNVLGFDPDITVDAAWSLPSQVRRATSVNDVLKQAQFVTLHVPLVEATRHLVNDANIGLMKRRRGAAQLQPRGRRRRQPRCSTRSRRTARPVRLRLPRRGAARPPAVIALPHLGASTREAEDNCAVMVVDQLRDYLEHGNLVNAVNFPQVTMARESAYRVAIANANVPNMLGQISTAMAHGRAQHPQHGQQVARRHGVHAGRRRQPGAARGAAGLAAINGVLAVRYLPVP
jgi:D-3-phosphoglycerate dehydrogenase